MKKLLTLVLALASLAVFPGLGVAQERKPGPGVPPIDGHLSLPCCKCVGDVNKLDLSTGSAPWSVSPGLGPTKTILSAWTAAPVPPASWIQPVSPQAATASKSVPAGLYNYKVSFTIPDNCTIPYEKMELSGSFAADNSVPSSSLTGSTPPFNHTCIAPAGSKNCFTTLTPLLWSGTLGTGVKMLSFDVNNEGSYSGLLVNATLTGKCKGPIK